MNVQLEKLLSVLIIDDNEIDIFLQERILQTSGMSREISSFISPRKALAYLEELNSRGEPFPELVLLDINMPGMNGFQFLDAFNKISGPLKENCRFIIVTSSESMTDFEKAFSYSNVVSYKVKPLSYEDVAGFICYFK